MILSLGNRPFLNAFLLTGWLIVAGGVLWLSSTVISGQSFEWGRPLQPPQRPPPRRPFSQAPPHPPPPPGSPPDADYENSDWSSDEDRGGLRLEDFEQILPNKYDKSHTDWYRYESPESWRSPDTFDSGELDPALRPPLQGVDHYRSKGEYLKQPLIADYADGAEKLFLMIKDGSNVIWERLPIHFLTTLTRVPHFALYADSPGSMGGYEIIDILHNTTQETLDSCADFIYYKKMKTLRSERGVYDTSSIKSNTGWGLDRFKNIPMLAHAYQRSPNSDWFVFIDADSYLMMDNLMEYLKTKDPNVPAYIGSAAALNNLNFAHGGSGVVLSRKAVELTVGSHPEYIAHYEKEAINQCCGDYMVAKMLKDSIDLGIEWEGRFQGNSFYNVKLERSRWCTPIVSFHHLTPHEIEILWEYERLKGPQERKHITYYDIYKDFQLPYIVPRRYNWDNEAGGTSFKNDEKFSDTDNLVPAKSVDNCEKACQLTKNCLMYRLVVEKENENLCTLEDGGVKLGVAAYPWIEGSRFNSTSGWMIDRIQELRKTLKCDGLYKLKELNNLNEPETFLLEGWKMKSDENVQAPNGNTSLSHADGHIKNIRNVDY